MKKTGTNSDYFIFITVIIMNAELKIFKNYIIEET